MKGHLLLIIALIIGLLLGAGVGFYVGDKGVIRLGQTDLAGVVEAYPQIDFSLCQEGGAINETCFSTLLTNEAVKKQNMVICEAITQEAAQATCLARVKRVATLEEATLCGDLGDDGLCQDLSHFMLAREQQDLEQCSFILEEELKSLCDGSVSADATPREVLSGDLRPLEEKGSAFGPLCDITQDDACLNDYRVYARAIRESDTALCSGAKDEISQGLCKYEVLFSAILASGSSVDCVKAQSPDGCKLDFLNSYALEQENRALCANHETQEMQAVCENLYDSTTEKRFDYSLVF